MQKVVIAGIPRSGTTFVFDRFAEKSRKLGEISLDVVKTHGLAPPATFHDPYWYKVESFILDKAKCLFMFGDPVLSVISTRLNIYDEWHAKNCGCYENINSIDIYDRDYFHYESMFDSWMKPHGYPVASVRYEALEKNRGNINEFFHENITWHLFRDRNTSVSDVSKEDLRRIRKTYESLIKKIRGAPDFRVW